MKKYFQNLFTYNNWANNKIIYSLQQLVIVDKKILNILSHIISTQDAWLERLKQTPNYSMNIWEPYSLQEIKVLSQNSSNTWKNFLHRLNKKKFDDICTYRNSKRKEFSNTYSEIMQHVISHSDYHRGQINLLLKNNKVEPIEVDYVLYTRGKN
jgi:uncharacterized damage-inducible protein DinB